MAGYKGLRFLVIVLIFSFGYEEFSYGFFSWRRYRRPKPYSPNHGWCVRYRNDWVNKCVGSDKNPEKRFTCYRKSINAKYYKFDRCQRHRHGLKREADKQLNALRELANETCSKRGLALRADLRKCVLEKSSTEKRNQCAEKIFKKLDIDFCQISYRSLKAELAQMDRNINGASLLDHQNECNAVSQPILYRHVNVSPNPIRKIF